MARLAALDDWPQACGEDFLEGYGVEIQWDRPPRGWGEPRIVQFAALLQDPRRRYFALIRHLTGATMVPAEVSAPAAVLITGVGVIADRLASQRHYWLPKAQAPAFGAAEHYAQAVKDAPALIEESGLARITLPETPFARAHSGLMAPSGRAGGWAGTAGWWSGPCPARLPPPRPPLRA